MQDKRTNDQINTEDRATQPMEAGGWVSQFFSRNFSGCFDTSSGSMILLLVPEISPWDSLCDRRARAAGGGIGYSSSWTLPLRIVFANTVPRECIYQHSCLSRDLKHDATLLSPVYNICIDNTLSGKAKLKRNASKFLLAELGWVDNGEQFARSLISFTLTPTPTLESTPTIPTLH